MKRAPYGKYTKEFRVEAVKLVTEQGLSVPEASQRLSLSKSTLTNWVKAYQAGKLADIGQNRRELGDKEMEMARLKKELEEARMENEILKKAAAYFAKGSL